MTPARLVAALPPAASQYLSKYIDPGDAYIAACEGLFTKQARSRARNARRSMGSSWPDRLPAGVLIDPEEWHEIQHSHGFHALDPLEILLAAEAAAEALAAPGAAGRLTQADIHETDTSAMSDVFKITQRRAQQIKAQREVQAGAQMVLFCDDGVTL